jgi:hypothetical protein
MFGYEFNSAVVSDEYPNLLCLAGLLLNGNAVSLSHPDFPLKTSTTLGYLDQNDNTATYGDILPDNKPPDSFLSIDFNPLLRSDSSRGVSSWPSRTPSSPRLNPAFPAITSIGFSLYLEQLPHARPSPRSFPHKKSQDNQLCLIPRCVTYPSNFTGSSGGICSTTEGMMS